VLEHLHGVLLLPVTSLCPSSGMRLNGRHGTSGSTGTNPGSTAAVRQHDLASSSGMGKCLMPVCDHSRNNSVAIFDTFYVHCYALVLLSTPGFFLHWQKWLFLLGARMGLFSSNHRVGSLTRKICRAVRY
jgi:hypothetical protein